MKTIAKFLLAVLSCAPIMAGAAPVATTAGSNLTQYNGSMGNVAGNQWNNATNPRTNAQNNTVKADYVNCNAVILRCATPKCSGGGCSDINVAKPIVAGCVNSNNTCKKYGDALIEDIAAQLVSDSVAAANKQAAAAAAASEQNAQQIAQMQQQMQQQMAQMQQQNNAQIASLQNALAESQRATNQAVQEAAQNAAANVMTNSSTVVDAGTGLTAVQSAAAKSGVDTEIIQRATISGQILTSMQGVDKSLKNLKSTMRDAFRYAGCNEVNGDNCTGPKRVAKFRDLAKKFRDPYESLADNLELALTTAQSVGVDLGNIYMFFSGSCNRWAEYICRYNGTANGKRPKYARKDKDTPLGENEIKDSCDSNGKSLKTGVVKAGFDCADGVAIQPEALTICIPNKMLDPVKDNINERVLDPDIGDDAQVLVGCASDGVVSGILKRRSSSSKGKGGIDIDLLDMMINQSEMGAKYEGNPCIGGNKLTSNAACYCGLGMSGEDKTDAVNKLTAVTMSKTLSSGAGEKSGVCCSEIGDCKVDCYNMDEAVSYVDPLFALCDAHAWNMGIKENPEKSEDKSEMKKIVALKTTVIAQQMYKNYSSLETMIRQLKIMLEKEALKAQLQMAGAASDENADNVTVAFDNCNTKDDDADVLTCLRGNFAKYEPFVTKKIKKKSVMKQMAEDEKLFGSVISVSQGATAFTTGKCKESMNSDQLKGCYDNLQTGIRQLNKQVKEGNKEHKSITLSL